MNSNSVCVVEGENRCGARARNRITAFMQLFCTNNFFGLTLVIYMARIFAHNTAGGLMLVVGCPITWQLMFPLASRYGWRFDDRCVVVSRVACATA